MFLKLAIKSLRERRGSVFLTLMAMTFSVFVLLAVEHVRHQAKESFANTVSGVDLIGGARTGSLNLLLYSVFRIGSPTNTISWEAFQEIANMPDVKWAIPLSLGDSHKGYRVMGTTNAYFSHFSYGKKHKLVFEQGQVFNGVLDVVLGHSVAKKLNYSLGDKLILSHGIAKTSFKQHDDHPFTVVGILAPTGTPVDHTVHVRLAGIEAIHSDSKVGKTQESTTHSDHHEDEHMNKHEHDDHELQPKRITAYMLGLKSRLKTFQVQRDINNIKQDPMLAILPGVALSELWQIMAMLENTLFFVAILVFISALLGLSAMLLSSIRDRAQEIRLLRIVGASPVFLFFLIELEALFITLTSLVLGAGLLFICLLATQDLIISQFGLHISSNIFSKNTGWFMGGILIASAILVAIPSLSAYRKANKLAMR